MQARNTSEASAIPANDGLPRLARRYQAHNPAAGKNASREVLFSAATPHGKPKPNQGSHPLPSSSVSAIQKIIASSRADKLVSQTHRVHQNITFGKSAQAHAEPTATFSENIRRAIRKIGTQVSAEKTLLSASSTHADALE